VAPSDGQNTDKTRSLDVGCGAAPDLPAADVQVGLDISLSSLRQCQQLYPHAHFVCGDGERLPFRDGAFDALVSRVALPLMNLNAAIPEMSRVLKPSAPAILNLHHVGFAWRDLLRRIRTGRPAAIAGGLWALFNGCVFHVFGRTLRLPFTRRFYDSFQTHSSMKRILRRHGFSDRVVDVIKARKLDGEPDRQA
jgi:ubiquinone/menaquinone biosynthesis C-methylase UbiE